MAHDEQYEPIDDWMHSEKVSVATLLYAERAGYPLPVWFRDRNDVRVNVVRAYNWKEILKILCAA
jgi:hypothetical protein